MSILGWVIVSCSVGGILSLLITIIGIRWIKASWIPHAVSYSVGAMLAAVFGDLIPHGLEHASSPQFFLLCILFGIIFLFILEKLFVWRHDHHLHEHAHEAADCDHNSHRKSTALKVFIGDSVHNFIDGILISASFAANPVLGINTAFAIVAHEIPQELGDAIVLIHAGYQTKRALLLNSITSISMLLGGLIGYYFVGYFQSLLLPLLALVSANMLYVTTSDLMPNLHKERTRKEAITQGGLMLLGIATVLATHLFHH